MTLLRGIAPPRSALSPGTCTAGWLWHHFHSLYCGNRQHAGVTNSFGHLCTRGSWGRSRDKSLSQKRKPTFYFILKKHTLLFVAYFQTDQKPAPFLSHFSAWFWGGPATVSKQLDKFPFGRNLGKLRGCSCPKKPERLPPLNPVHRKLRCAAQHWCGVSKSFLDTSTDIRKPLIKTESGVIYFFKASLWP